MLESTYNDWNESGWNTTPLEAYHTLRTRLNPPQNTEIGGKERLAQEVMTLYQRIQFEISPNIKLALTKHHQNQLVPKYDICLWTDGSLVREDGKVKAAAGWCYSNDERKEVGNTKVQPALSSYHSESVAMTKGLEQLLEDPNFTTSNATIGIFTDSHGLCDHLMKLKREDIPVETHTQSLVEQLNRLLQTQPEKVTIHWIPGHKSIGDNELADEQAEKGYKSKKHGDHTLYQEVAQDKTNGTTYSTLP